MELTLQVTRPPQEEPALLQLLSFSAHRQQMRHSLFVSGYTHGDGDGDGDGDGVRVIAYAALGFFSAPSPTSTMSSTT